MGKIFCFIKFSERKYADTLLEEGEIYFSLPRSFENLKNNERGDDNEGAEWIDNTQITNIKLEHPTTGTLEFKPVPNSIFKLVQYNYYFLSFSLYAITSDSFNNDENFKIDPRMRKFDDTAIIISEPYIFLESIEAELKSKNLKYEMDHTTYRDLTNGKIDLTPFDKKQEHQHQQEFRIIIENTDNAAKSIKIGSIEKYSKKVSSKYILECTWTATRKT